jgi:hypothetical protein
VDYFGSNQYASDQLWYFQEPEGYGSGYIEEERIGEMR